MIESGPVLAVALVAIASGSLLLLRERKQKGLYTLLYHRLHGENTTLPGSEALFSVAADRFAEQIDALLDAGYHFVSPRQALSMVEGRHPITDKGVLIAFDDGCESIYSLAEPILTSRDIQGLVFVTTDPEAFVFHLPDNPQPRCSEQQIHELLEKGWMFGVHSATHLPPGSLDAEALTRDFSESTQWLNAITGNPIKDYAVPGNFHAPILTKVAKKMGIQRIWSASPGVITSSSKPDNLPRLGVEGTMTGSQLLRSLNPGNRLWRKALSWAKRLPVKMLGPEKWIPIRRRIFHILRPFSLSQRFWAAVLLVIVATLLTLIITFLNS